MLHRDARSSSHSATSDGLMLLTDRSANSGATWLRYTDSYRTRLEAPTWRSFSHFTAMVPNSSRPAFGPTYTPRSASASILAPYFFAASSSRNAFEPSFPSGSSQTASQRLASLLPPRSGCRPVLRRPLSNQRSRTLLTGSPFLVVVRGAAGFPSGNRRGEPAAGQDPRDGVRQRGRGVPERLQRGAQVRQPQRQLADGVQVEDPLLLLPAAG